jgi:glycosyltransferase involved in cell wall biosynthesis
MKILRVITSMNPIAGGPCQGIRNSIPALKALGVDNEVVCLDAPDADYLGKDDFTIHALGTGKGPWAYNKQLIPWLIKNAPNYDAIIVHGLWQFTSYAVYKAAKYLRLKASKSIPYYVMPHGMLDPYFQKAPERRLKAIRNRIFWSLIEGKVINNANSVLFTCQEELLLARETFSSYHPKHEFNVGYGILEPPMRTPEILKTFYEICPDLNGAPFLLFLSRIHPKKGVDILLRSYKDWLESRDIKKNVKLVVAGPGLETEFGRQLQAMVNSHKVLKENVYFTGMLKGDAKWGAFYASDAFVLNSHQENFGISIVEALACEKPVLISNKVNIWREIDEGHAGFVDDDTELGTRKLLLKWDALDFDEKSEMCKNARRTFEKFYAIGPAAKRLKEVIIDKAY